MSIPQPFLEQPQVDLDIESVGAIIFTSDGRYLVQLRDKLPHVRYGGFWGVFGGRVEGTETLEQAFLREMLEELAFIPEQFSRFTDLTFPHNDERVGYHRRYFFECCITESELAALRLFEGAEMRALFLHEIQMLSPIVPCDAFALLAHAYAFGVLK